MGLGFVEKMRAASAAERWVARVRFPGVSVEAANGARKMLVATFVRGWSDNVGSGLAEASAFAEFSKTFLASLPEETRNHPCTAGTMQGLEVAFRAGWGAAERRRLGIKLS